MDRKKPYLIVILALLVFASLAALSLAAGREGSWSRPGGRMPHRIVSLAPSVTEFLFALGLDAEVVGVTDFCDYPPVAKTRPSVGGFKGKSLEAIVALSPDLVIGTQDGNEAALLATLGRLGIRVSSIQPSTLIGVIESVREIGRAVGRESEAEALARELEGKLMEVSSRVRGAEPVKVLFVYGRAPLVLAGPGTFADDMIRWAGGVNAAADARAPYPRFSMEAVLSREPQVIVEGAMGSESLDAKFAEARAFWSRWESLPAVRDGRLLLMDQDLIARPGPRLFDGLEALARALHPERFGDDR